MFLALILLTVIGCQSSNAQYRDITVNEAENLISKPNTYLLDVRTPEEYQEAHLEGATLIPVGELESRLGELEAQKDKEVIVYCRSGSRSAKASEILSKKGYQVANVEGGITAWQSAGKPVVAGSK
jgi:rhodanese-related sulfurtransferase